MFILTKDGAQELDRNPDGSPTDMEIQEWKRWSENGSHLHNNRAEPCPCCGGSCTYYLADGWRMCFDCILPFEREDTLPVISREEHEQQVKLESESTQQTRLENSANRLEQLAYNLEHMMDKEA